MYNDTVLLYLCAIYTSCSGDNDVEQQDMDELLGKNEVLFVPYLMGERSPHNDVNAKSLFFGMRPNTTKKEMLLAIFEGVAFAIKDCVEAIKANGITILRSTICGGGAKSEVWKKIFANVLDIEIQLIETEQGPGFGAAVLAMVATNEYANVQSAIGNILHYKSSVKPDKILSEQYQKQYEIYKKLYPSLKGI